jgi:hypothetical protein
VNLGECYKVPPSSGTKYSVNGILTSFAEFDVKDLDLDRDGDRFRLKANFKLGDGSQGINFLTDDVALQIGAFSTVIPAGSFHLRPSDRDDQEEQAEQAEAKYSFDGAINGVTLRVEVRTAPGRRFHFEAMGQGADLKGTTNPVSVSLSVGLNGGSAKRTDRRAE